MRYTTEQRIKDRVRRNEPVGARGYYLSSTIGRFPSTGALRLDPFQYPHMIPMGSYRLFFTVSLTDSSAMAQKHEGDTPPTVEIWEEENHAGERTALAHQADSAKVSVSEAKQVREKWQDDPRHISDRIEYQAERFSDELQENKALIGKKLRHSAEVAEGFVLQRAYRHELVATAQNFSAFQERQVSLFERMSETHLSLAARLQAPPTPPTPPTPPDLLGQSLPALLMLGNTIAKKLFGSGKDDDDDDDDAVDATLNTEHLKLLKVKKQLEIRVAKLERDKRTSKPGKGSKGTPSKGKSGKQHGKDKSKSSRVHPKRKRSQGHSAGELRKKPKPAPTVGSKVSNGVGNDATLRTSDKPAAEKKAARKSGKINGVVGSSTQEKA